ncbi:alpha/beta hydrolase [Nocardioides flavescens]|uniref:Alpha/beta hydrolase fold domain-containing protein n=1 Tax=Nocardioides flavescens TaxID=2691959 RepID=A0A6L7F167_9ACTN|nr:alpha/beta hydrolase [Nocardioides flavescens]MXG90072.1 alpha/beta hydrolase fold domain-containing protein [Nocardioides flavescens]
MPSRRHELLARLIPRLRRSSELDSVEAERARLEHHHTLPGQGPQRGLPTSLVPFFHRRFTVVREELAGPGGSGFPAYVVTPRGRSPRRTLVHLHGGGFVSPIDPFHVRWATRLATRLGARVVLPDYPLAPEHTWRDSHRALVDLTARWVADSPDGVVLSGDSAGGGLALAVALTLRDEGVSPSHLLLIAPWVDLGESTPETEAAARTDPWLTITKLRAYAAWWAGSEADLERPEVSPALADLSGLPPALMFFGTRDLLHPGGRLLTRRAREAGWALTSVEEPGLIHVYPILPIVPEARRAFGQTLEFLR